MKMRFILLLMLIFIASGCDGDISNAEYHPSPKSMLVDQISNTVFGQLKKEKNLHPIECGGRMMHQITLLHWGFLYYKDISIDEARELLMSTGHQFLEAFNADERIRPYLAVYPFTPKNIQVEIFLKNPDGSEIGPDKLHVVSIMEGLFDYMIECPETQRLKKIYIETYDEAASKLNAAIQF